MKTLKDKEVETILISGLRGKVIPVEDIKQCFKEIIEEIEKKEMEEYLGMMGLQMAKQIIKQNSGFEE